MRADTNAGFTLIELIIVVAIAGILLTISAVRLNPNGVATRQAAQAIASAVAQARFEAVRTNGTAGLLIEADTGGGSGAVSLCRDVDETASPLACDPANTSVIVDLGDGEFRRVIVASPGSLSVFFDRRGIVRNPGSGNTVTVTDRSGGNVRTVDIAPTGRTEVN